MSEPNPWPPMCAPQLETHTHSNPFCSMSQLHTRVRAAPTEESAQCIWMEPAQTQNRIWMGQGQPLLAILEATHWERFGTLTGTRTNPVQALTHAEHPSSSSCSNTTPLWVEGARAGRGESTHLEGMEPSRTQTSGPLLQQCGTRSIRKELQENGASFLQMLSTYFC